MNLFKSKRNEIIMNVDLYKKDVKWCSVFYITRFCKYERKFIFKQNYYLYLSSHKKIEKVQCEKMYILFVIRVK